MNKFHIKKKGFIWNAIPLPQNVNVPSTEVTILTAYCEEWISVTQNFRYFIYDKTGNWGQ